MAYLKMVALSSDVERKLKNNRNREQGVLSEF